MWKASLLMIAILIAGISTFFTFPVLAFFLTSIAVFALTYIEYMQRTLELQPSPEVEEEHFINWHAVAEKPKVWIVDDDADTALAMQAGLKRMGIPSQVLDVTRDLHRKIIFDHADYILLDWMLSSNVTADMVLKKAIRLINTIEDIKSEFNKNPARVITFSALDEDQIHVPANRYFEHTGHLEKSVPRAQALQKFSRLMHNSMEARVVT